MAYGIFIFQKLQMDALVTSLGISPSATEAGTYGNLGWVEPAAVSNSKRSHDLVEDFDSITLPGGTV